MNESLRILALLAVALLIGASPTRALRIVANGQTLPVIPIVEDQRVLLPMRAVFEALRAHVLYDRSLRRIDAFRDERHVTLYLGMRAATLDDRRVELDVPPRVVGGRAYVPLRFAAEGLGADVRYDARAGAVRVQSIPHDVAVEDVLPEPNARMDNGFPTISARVEADTAREGMRLEIDGNDVSRLASFDGKTLTFVPRTALAPGAHGVRFFGTTVDERNFSAQWSFETTLSPPPGYASWIGGFDFSLQGPAIAYAGDAMHFVLLAPPGGSAVLQLCTLGFQYPFWNQTATSYVANVIIPPAFAVPNCTIHAIYRSWNGRESVVQLGRTVTIAQPRVVPTPYVTPTPVVRHVPLPSPPRRPEATPTPKAAPRTVPTATPKPRVIPGKTPKPLP